MSPKIKYFSVYDVAYISLADGTAYTRYTPKACFHVDKFKVTYESGDYEELPDILAHMKAKDFCRLHLGCKFEGDLNPATENRVGSPQSESPCTQVIRFENHPFSLTYKLNEQ